MLTRPDVIDAIHDEYLEAGADIIETNTFTATSISQADYGLESAVLRDQLRGRAARATRRPTEWTEKTPDKPRFVAGAIGPTNRTLSISPDVNDPAFRAVTLRRGARRLRRAGARRCSRAASTCSLVETIFDTLNAKAAMFADRGGVRASAVATLPVMISVTITDRSGRTLSGQTIEAFWTSVAPRAGR